MIIVLSVLLFIVAIMALSLLLTPYVDNIIRFTRLGSLTIEELQKKFPSLGRECPATLLYLLPPEVLMFHLKLNLPFGGESDIYIHAPDNINIRSILIIPVKSGPKWFKQMKLKYFNNHRIKYQKVEATLYGQELYQVTPIPYQSHFLNSRLPMCQFDFGLSHNNQFFLYFKITQ